MGRIRWSKALEALPLKRTYLMTEMSHLRSFTVVSGYPIFTSDYCVNTSFLGGVQGILPRVHIFSKTDIEGGRRASIPLRPLHPNVLKQQSQGPFPSLL